MHLENFSIVLKLVLKLGPSDNYLLDLARLLANYDIATLEELEERLKESVKIPPELKGASLTIIGHPMMIEQVRQNHVLKAKLSRRDAALKIYADKENWRVQNIDGVFGSVYRVWKQNPFDHGYVVAQKAIKDMENQMTEPKHSAEPRDTNLWLEPKEVNPDRYHDFWEIPWSKDGEIAVEGVYGKANAYRIVEEHNTLVGIEDVVAWKEKARIALIEAGVAEVVYGDLFPKPTEDNEVEG